MLPANSGTLPSQEVASPYFVRINPNTGVGPMAIDSSTFTSGETTMAGGIRNSKQFWNQWLNQYPDTLSPANVDLINSRLSPVVDETWVNNFPEHTGYEGDTLIHHHLDYGPNAIPLPSPVHSQQPGWGIWHPAHAGGN